MKVPTAPATQSPGPAQEGPSPEALMMAVAELQQSGRVPAGPETGREMLSATGKSINRESLNPLGPEYKQFRQGKPERFEGADRDVVIHGEEGEELLVPGQNVPDRERGGTARRNVKGI